MTDQTLTAEQRLSRAAETARATATADAAAKIEREVAMSVRAEQRRIDREAAQASEAAKIAVAKVQFADDNGISHLPQAVTDMVWSLAWQEGHSSGFGEVEMHYSEIAPIVYAAFEAGKSAKG